MQDSHRPEIILSRGYTNLFLARLCASLPPPEISEAPDDVSEASSRLIPPARRDRLRNVLIMKGNFAPARSPGCLAAPRFGFNNHEIIFSIAQSARNRRVRLRSLIWRTYRPDFADFCGSNDLTIPPSRPTRDINERRTV